jgi:hypothetical protein
MAWLNHDVFHEADVRLCVTPARDTAKIAPLSLDILSMSLFFCILVVRVA